MKPIHDEPTAPMKTAMERLRRAEIIFEGPQAGYIAVGNTVRGLMRRGFITKSENGYGMYVLTDAGRAKADMMLIGEKVSEKLQEQKHG